MYETQYDHLQPTAQTFPMAFVRVTQSIGSFFCQYVQCLNAGLPVAWVPVCLVCGYNAKIQQGLLHQSTALHFYNSSQAIFDAFFALWLPAIWLGPPGSRKR